MGLRIPGCLAGDDQVRARAEVGERRKPGDQRRESSGNLRIGTVSVDDLIADRIGVDGGVESLEDLAGCS